MRKKIGINLSFSKFNNAHVQIVELVQTECFFT